jgi:hypothetical protein
MLCVLSVTAIAQDKILLPQQAGPARAQPPQGSVGGMGDINLYPKRIVINERQRISSVGLFNRSASQGDYELTVSDMMMTADGRLVDLSSVTDAAERSRVAVASAMVRWSPRRVTLKPYEAQTVRLMARVPPGTPPGEYRAHFSAIAIPPDTGGTSIEQAAGSGSSNSISVNLVPRFGISIPVIVRIGETSVKVGLRDPRVVSLPNGSNALSLTITREGNRSAFGDIAVTVPGGKKPIAEIKGIGVYPEIGQRTVQVMFAAAAEPRLYGPGSRLVVTYTDDDFSPGAILARLEFTLP